MQESVSREDLGKPGMGDRMPKGVPLSALPLFFFIHVPKTGGSSLNFTLAQMFSPFSIFHEVIKTRAGGDGNIQAFLEANPGFYDNFMLIVGHLRFRHPLIQMAPRRRILLSVMREPIQRITSLYDFIRYSPGHSAHVALSEMSLLQAIRHHGAFRANCQSTQLRLIFGTPEADVARQLLRRRNYVIGRFDHLERFLGAVEAVSGLKRKEPLPHRNARPAGVTAEPATEQTDYAEAVEELKAMNAGDIGFYARLPPVLATTATA